RLLRFRVGVGQLLLQLLRLGEAGGLAIGLGLLQLLQAFAPVGGLLVGRPELALGFVEPGPELLGRFGGLGLGCRRRIPRYRRYNRCRITRRGWVESHLDSFLLPDHPATSDCKDSSTRMGP